MQPAGGSIAPWSPTFARPARDDVSGRLGLRLSGEPRDLIRRQVSGNALERSRRALEHEAKLTVLRESYASLTPREREVMALVASGLLNKQVGGELGISEITVKAHRGQVMRKMKADSLPALVHMVTRLSVSNARAA